jgi:hypothetical protein
MPVTRLVERQLRRRLPKPAYLFARSRYYDARKLAGRNPGRGRVLPDFLVIGAAKSGTTTLYGWLSEHPFVEPAVKKEVHFFDYSWYRGVDWYRSHFPFKRDRDAVRREQGRPFLTGEASPTYISHEWAPSRVAKVLPHAKLIVALRNPIDRAYSQFQLAQRENEEPLASFAEAVDAEESRLRPEHERLRRDPRYNSWPLGTWSYLWRSSYGEQIGHWFSHFPREQFHFLSAEELEADPRRALAGVYDFLRLPPHENANLGWLNTAPPYEPMPAEVRAKLVEYFRSRNERLYELVGIDFGWND